MLAKLTEARQAASGNGPRELPIRKAVSSTLDLAAQGQSAAADTDDDVVDVALDVALVDERINRSRKRAKRAQLEDTDNLSAGLGMLGDKLAHGKIL